MEIYATIVSFFQDGGLFMYPIVLVFAIGAAIAIERCVFLSVSGTRNRMVWIKLGQMLIAGN